MNLRFVFSLCCLLIALTGRVFSQTYLSQEFNTFSLPADWELQDQGTGPCRWGIGTPDDFPMLGSNFLYVNSFGEGTQALETITSPLINAPASGSVKLRFRHYFRDLPGSGTDTGFVEVFTGTAWEKLQAFSSTTGAENNPAPVELNLSPYLNPNLRIRFRYVAYSAFYWNIDNVKVFATPAANLGVTALPNVTGTCTVTLPFFPKVTVKNFGTASQSGFTLSYKAAGLPAVTETFTGTIAPEESATYTFSTPFSVPLRGKIRFKAWPSVAGDTDAENDTLFDFTSAMLPGFDAVTFTGYDGGNLGEVSPGWEEAVGDVPQTPYSNWTTSSDAQVNSLGSKTAKINLYSVFTRSWMISPPFQVKNGDHLRFKIALTDYISAGPDAMGSDDALIIRISTNCGQSWQDLQAFTAASGIGNQFQNKAIPLGAYSGQVVRIAFFATDGNIDDPNDCDLHLDNIRIGELFSGDANLAELRLPPGRCGQAASFPVTIRVVNNGTSQLTSLPAFFQVQGQNPVSQTFPLSLPSGADTVLVFSAQASVPNPGNYRISAWTLLPGEQNPSDDSLKGIPFFRVKSFFEKQDFTGYLGANPGYQWEEAGGLTPTGQISAWREADAAQIAGFGSETARASLFSNYNKAWMISPPFKPGPDVVLQFRLALTAANNYLPSTLGSDDSLIVRITTDCGQTWKNLRHYTAADALTLNLALQNIPLNPYAGQTVRIGFYATDGSIDNPNDVDIHIDEIRLKNNAPNDAEIIGLILPSADCGVPASFPVKVRVANSGTLALSSLPVSYQIQGQAPVSQVFPVSLPPAADTLLQFSAAVSVPNPGNFSISAWVSVPGDDNTAGDSLLAIPFYRVSQEFDIQNFTEYNGNNLTGGWEEKNGWAGNLQEGSFWTASTEAQTSGLGSKTARINLYGVQRKAWLVSPAFKPETGKALQFRLALTNWQTSAADSMGSDDSLIVKISTDCGETWQNLKTYTRANGLSNQLTTRKVSVAAFIGQTLRIAFYATDGLTDQENDYDLHIDDVELVNVSPNDLGITSLILPPLACGIPDSLQVRVKVANLGTQPQSGFIVGYSVDGGPANQETFPGSIAPLEQQEFLFAAAAPLTPTSPNVLRVWTLFAQDQDVSNDTLTSPPLQIIGSQLLPVDFTGFTGANLTELFPGWKEKSGTVPAGETSFWTVSTPTQTNVLGSTTARLALSGNTRREWIISPVFNPDTESEIRFSMALTDRNSIFPDNMGSDDSLKVLISQDCGQNWTLLRTFTAQNGLGNSLVPYKVDISAWTGQNCLFAFQGTDGNVNDTEDYEIHLDNIQLGPSTVAAGKLLEQPKTIRVFPNPAAGNKIHIMMPGPEKNLRFFSATGREFFPAPVSGEPDVYDTGNMPSGLYRIFSPRGGASFIIQK